MVRRASSAESPHSESTGSDANLASLHELTELRERLRFAETTTAQAMQRRETAQEDLARLAAELRELGYDPNGKQTFELWYASEEREITAMIFEVEKMLGYADVG